MATSVCQSAAWGSMLRPALCPKRCDRGYMQDEGRKKPPLCKLLFLPSSESVTPPHTFLAQVLPLACGL